MRKLIFLFSVSILLTGCTSIFYFPNDTLYPYYKFEKFPPEDLYFTSSDGTKLHAWHMSPNPKLCQKPKALVAHFHGNAQNLSAHYRMLSWLADECFDYYIFDYRGYGKSQGPLDTSGVLQDARAALKYFADLAKQKNLPYITIGQSIGGTLMLRSLQLDGPPQNLNAFVVESSFYRFTQIGNEKLASVWFLWPFQWLPYLAVSDEASPGRGDFSKLNKVPKLLIYSKKDPVVEFHNGPNLFTELPEPKWFWSHEVPGHINSMFVENGKYRKQLMSWFDWVLKNEMR